MKKQEWTGQAFLPAQFVLSQPSGSHPVLPFHCAGNWTKYLHFFASILKDARKMAVDRLGNAWLAVLQGSFLWRLILFSVTAALPQ